MNTIATPSQPTRKVGILLAVAIFILPFPFVLFLFQSGRSTLARTLGFGWLAIWGILLMTNGADSPATNKPSAALASSASEMPEKPAPVATEDSEAARMKMIASLADRITKAEEQDNGKQLFLVQTEKSVWSEESWVTSVGFWNKDFLSALQKEFPDRYSSVTIKYDIPTVDKYGNSSIDQAMRLTYDMSEVKKINFDGITNAGILRFAKASLYPVGRGAVIKWCADGNSNDASEFCQQAMQ